MPISLRVPAEANDLLRRDPLTVLLGLTLDQQMPELWRICRSATPARYSARVRKRAVAIASGSAC